MEISDIKQRLLLTQVLAHYGLKPDKNQRLHCPWHDDKTPSLQLYSKANRWTCFGNNCSAGSDDAIEFIERMEGQGKHHAIMKAKELVGMLSEAKSRPLSGEGDKHKGILVAKTLVNARLPDGQGMSSNEPSQMSRIAVLTKLFGYFRNAVSSSKPARDYLERRNLNPTPNWRKSVTCGKSMGSRVYNSE